MIYYFKTFHKTVNTKIKLLFTPMKKRFFFSDSNIKMYTNHSNKMAEYNETLRTCQTLSNQNTVLMFKIQ